MHRKRMGIITLALFTGTKAGSFDHWPGWLDFSENAIVRTPKMGHRSMRRDDGGGNGGWWLAHHSARSAIGW